MENIKRKHAPVVIFLALLVAYIGATYYVDETTPPYVSALAYLEAEEMGKCELIQIAPHTSDISKDVYSFDCGGLAVSVANPDTIRLYNERKFGK